MESSFYSNGKLLLTGEYAILDGALSLAVPTTFGQSMKISASESSSLVWKSVNEKGVKWFEGTYNLEKFNEIASSNQDISNVLKGILSEVRVLNPHFLTDGNGYVVETRLTFPRDWGLGSSSTLINNIAQWGEVDAFQLLWNTFSGSGYDIACAQHDYPILYRLKGKKPVIESVDFNPSFKDQLYFVHLNKKQDSREGISAYRKMDFEKTTILQRISEITREVVNCNALDTFEGLLAEHEAVLASVLKKPKVKDILFPDYSGAIKSLGAWGGDFVLATRKENTHDYFKSKGFQTVIPFQEMVL